MLRKPNLAYPAVISILALGTASTSAQDCGWEAMGGGMDDRIICLTPHDAGTGESLYAGGTFTSAGGWDANYLARWDGCGWRPVGGDLDSWVVAMETFDDGTGDALYACGFFTIADGIPVGGIARWDGSLWSDLDGGMNIGGVRTLAVFDDGTGSALYAGGDFSTAGGVAASNIAKWDGSSWSPLGSGVAGGPGGVYNLHVYDDGSGPALYVGGWFETAGGITANGIAKWDGTSWTTVGTGVGVLADEAVIWFEVFDDGTGPELYVGGEFASMNGQPATGLAKWDGSIWTNFTDLVDDDRQVVWGMTTLGDDLYVSGQFNSAGGVAVGNIARWDGSSWSAVGDGMDSFVEVVTTFNDDGRERLAAAGWFTQTDGRPANRIASWDCVGEPVFDVQPENVLLDAEATPATFEISATGEPTIEYQWRKDGIALVDGGAITGATTPTLELVASLEHIGVYDCVATNDLGEATSDSAVLAFRTNPCAADFDGDGSLTIFDFLAFQNAFAAGCP